jgi:hypothetical protein
MKRAFLLLLIGSVPFISHAATSNQPQDPKSAYAQAVANYVEAASKEIQAFHDQVNAQLAKATPERKRALSEVKPKLDRCDSLLAELKDSGPSTFDKIKSAYEKARAEAATSIASALKS